MQVVVSHYSETTVDETQKRFADHAVVVYTKQEDSTCRPQGSTVLPNVGREGHTWLHHIVTYYEDLPEVLFCLPASKVPYVDDVLSMLERSDRQFGAWYEPVSMLSDGYRFTMSHWQGRGDHWPIALLAPSVEPFGAWFDAFIESPRPVRATGLGIFIVARVLVLQRPKAFYERLLAEMSRGQHSAPAAGHYLERCWGTIFGREPPPL